MYSQTCPTFMASIRPWLEMPTSYGGFPIMRANIEIGVLPGCVNASSELLDQTATNEFGQTWRLG